MHKETEKKTQAMCCHHERMMSNGVVTMQERKMFLHGLVTMQDMGGGCSALKYTQEGYRGREREREREREGEDIRPNTVT